MSELNSRLAEIRRELEDAGKNLSNMMKYINQTIEMFCKLGLWSDTNFSGSVVILGDWGDLIQGNHIPKN